MACGSNWLCRTWAAASPATSIIDIDRGIHLGAQAGVEARKTFLTNGVRFQNNGEIVAVNALKAAEPTREITIVKAPGWHMLEDVEVPFFVAPDGTVFGLPEGREVELSANAKLLRPIARKGTMAGWKAAVAAALRVRDCPHWGIGLFSGFAGCLISLVEDDSCGVNLSGLSSSGKTTAQRLAVSPWSRPIVGKTSLMQSAKATSNGAEAMAAKANGSVLVLDELAHITGKELTKIVYLVAGGTGKTRMDANADLRASYEWRTFGVLSAETSLEEKIRSDGGEWTAGQAVRIPDIDITGLNRHVSLDVMDKISDIRHHYGHSGHAFVEGLIANGLHRDPDSLRKRIGDLALKIAASNGEKNGSDAALRRAAYPFAVLMTAGQLAKDFGLIPDDTNVTAIIAWAWGRFKKSSDAVALDPEAQVVANLQRWIAERWGSSIHSLVSSDYDKATSKDAVGWFDDEAVYLSDQRLVEAAGVSLKETEIARALNSRGLLTKRKDAEHLSISFVPRAGRMKAYALSGINLGAARTQNHPCMLWLEDLTMDLDSLFQRAFDGFGAAEFPDVPGSPEASGNGHHIDKTSISRCSRISRSEKEVLGSDHDFEPKNGINFSADDRAREDPFKTPGNPGTPGKEGEKSCKINAPPVPGKRYRTGNTGNRFRGRGPLLACLNTQRAPAHQPRRCPRRGRPRAAHLG